MALEANTRILSAIQPFTVITGYKDSGEAAMRQFVRKAIRASGFSKSEREVMTVLVNHWFYHKNGPKGYIHPGRKRLARLARVSVRTVASCLSKLRDAGVVRVIANPRGEGQKPTQYTVDLCALIKACGCDLPETIAGYLAPLIGVENCTPLLPEIAHHCRAEIAHSLSDVEPHPSQSGSFDVGGAA